VAHCSAADAEAIAALARERGIPTHLDGARIFNAAVAVGRPRPFWRGRSIR